MKRVLVLFTALLFPRLWTLVAAIVLTLAVPSMCEAGETTRQPRNEDGMAPSVITNPGARFQDNA